VALVQSSAETSETDTTPLPREITLVRHGATAWSKSGQHTGRTDIPLDEDGRAEAVALGARLAGASFDAVVTSPLSRALETAQLAGYGGVAVENADLQEWDYGDYEGRTTAAIRRDRPGWSLFDDGCPGGESATEVGKRADSVLASVAGYERVLLFAHGHMLRVLAARWLELPPDEGRRLRLDPATLSRLGWEHETAVLLLWNS
jgi:probable phosphoglycerate mutase